MVDASKWELLESSSDDGGLTIFDGCDPICEHIASIEIGRLFLEAAQRPIQRKLYNERALLWALWLADSKGPHWVQFYCRPIKTFVIGSTRFYHVRPCDSVFGKIHPDAPTYCYAQDMLQDSRRRFGKDGKEIKK